MVVATVTFSYVSSLPVTWQRCQSHHSIRRTRKPHAACKHQGCMFYRTRALADRRFALRE